MSVRISYFWTLRVKHNAYAAVLRKYKDRTRLVGDNSHHLSTSKVTEEVIPLDYLHHSIADNKIVEFSTEEDAEILIRMSAEPEWHISPFYVSGVFSGYRVARTFPDGRQEISKTFVYDRYSGEDIETLRAAAQAHCEEENE